MFGKLMSSFGFDKEKIVRETIEASLENVLEEVNKGRSADELYRHSNIFIMIQPINNEFEFVCQIYTTVKGSLPKKVREILLNEILGGDE